MLSKLRHKLTLICVSITTCVLLFMAIISLLTCETQLSNERKLSLDNDLNTVIYYLQTCSFISPLWLSQTEVANNLIINIEQNHKALLYQGSYQTMSTRESLIALVQSQAQKKNIELYTSPSANNIPLASRQFEISTDYNEHFLVTTSSITISDVPFQITLLKNMHKDDLQILHIRLLFLLICLACIIGLTFFSWWFSGRAIKPIEVNNQKQKEFIAAASHELRAPITVIQTNASILEKQVDINANFFVTTISSECARISKLINDLLTLANIDAKANWTLNLQPAELDTLLLELYDTFYITAEEKQHPLTLELPDTSITPVQIDINRLKQVLIILLDNALSHTPIHTPIKLLLEDTKTSYRIKVIDQGPGIPDTYKPSIFERFYQVDSSRHAKEHYGLGLSIAQEIIKLHHGTLTLEDTPTGGCTFIITLIKSC